MIDISGCREDFHESSCIGSTLFTLLDDSTAIPRSLQINHHSCGGCSRIRYSVPTSLTGGNNSLPDDRKSDCRQYRLLQSCYDETESLTPKLTSAFNLQRNNLRIYEPNTAAGNNLPVLKTTHLTPQLILRKFSPFFSHHPPHRHHRHYLGYRSALGVDSKESASNGVSLPPLPSHEPFKQVELCGGSSTIRISRKMQ